MRAVVRISGEKIVEVEVLDSAAPVIDRQDPTDSCIVVDEYLIPGLLDTGVRLNSVWEDLTQLTFRALQGGVVGLFIEEGIHHETQTISPNLFSDVFLVKTVQSPDEIGNQLPSSHAFKIYVSDQSAIISSVKNLEEVCRQIYELKGILMIDCSLPYRMLLNSPLRYEPAESRSIVTFSLTDEIATGFDPISCLSEDDQEDSDMITNENISAELIEIHSNIQERKKNYTEYMNSNKEAYLFNSTQSRQVSPSKKSTQIRPSKNKRRKMNLSVDTTKIIKKITHWDFVLNYPDSYETNGIKKIFKSVEDRPIKIHFSGLSSSEAVFLIQMSKEKYDLTIETSVPYLATSAEKILPNDTRFKLSPPVRSEKNRKDLWKLVQLDSVDVIASKHEYVPLEFKSYHTQEFQRALNGFPTLGHSLSLVWTAFLELNPHLSPDDKDRELVKIVKKMSENIAHRFGIEQYGKIQAGQFANLVVFNPEGEGFQQLYEDHLCPFEEMPLRGTVKQVYLRGKLALSEGRSSQYGNLLT